MQGARSRKFPGSFFVLVFAAASLLAFFPAPGQARPGVDSPLTGTTVVLDPAEPTLTPTDAESPLPETPSPSPDFPSPTLTPSPTDTPQPTIAASETPVEQTLLLLGLSRTASLERFEQSIPYPVVDIGLDALGIYAIWVPEAQAEEIMGELSSLPEVRYVEPNYTVTGQEVIPNDPGFAFQYALVNIRAPQAWDITTGSSAVTIAIIDSGVDLSHPELAPKLLPGRDFVNGDWVAQDDNGHGTHVAGIAAAASNNGLGMAGVSWGARILPVKALNAFNSGTYANVAEGIKWATDQGAQVINLSLGGPNSSQTLEDAIAYAASRGVAIVAAAGNTGGDILYPARYPAVIAVANTNAANQRVSTSAFGPEIDLSAPGAGIYSLAIGGGYRYLGGTSMSAPHVSGALALLLSLPGVSAGQARAYLETSALDIDSPGWDIYTGSGLIQLDAALLLAIPASPTPTLASAIHSTRAPVTVFPFAGSGGDPATLTGTATILLPSASPTPTQTPAAPLASPTPTVTPSPTATFPATEPPGPSAWMPCLGAALLLIGLLLAVWAARSRRH